MSTLKPIYISIFTGLFLLFCLECSARDFESRYATITYFDKDDLREFNNELYMGRQLKAKLQKNMGDTIEDDVAAKINLIVEKVMLVLDMYQPDIRFSIVINTDEISVQEAFRNIYYGVDVDYIAFYSPSKNRVFYSADNSNLRVVAHEIGHVVFENYFSRSPPRRIHEVIAQFAERHVDD